MKKTAVTVAVLALAFATGAGAYLGQVQGSFRSPAGTDTRGLARAAGYLYVVDGSVRGIVYRIHPISGSVYNWHVLPWAGANSGLAYSTPSYLWVGCLSNGVVYRTADLTGSIYSSWNAGHDPYGCAALCTGDGGSGTTHIFTTDNAPDYLFTHRLGDGSIVNSFPLGTASNYDCAFDWRNNLLWRGGGNYIYAHTPAGSIVTSFPSPAGSPRGMTYNNSRLWIACTADSLIYRVHCPEDFYAVEPASLGRVRAMFR